MKSGSGAPCATRSVPSPLTSTCGIGPCVQLLLYWNNNSSSKKLKSIPAKKTAVAFNRIKGKYIFSVQIHGENRGIAYGVGRLTARLIITCTKTSQPC